MHFHNDTIWPNLRTRTPALGVMKITILEYPSFIIIYMHYALSLSESCPWEETIFKEIIHFYYMTYMSTPLHKNLCPGAHGIHNFGILFLGFHYFILSLSDLCLELERFFFFRKNAFSLYDICPHPSKETIPRGSWNLQILVNPSLVIITIQIICQNHTRRREEDF